MLNNYWDMSSNYLGPDPKPTERNGKIPIDFNRLWIRLLVLKIGRETFFKRDFRKV